MAIALTVSIALTIAITLTTIALSMTMSIARETGAIEQTNSSASHNRTKIHMGILQDKFLQLAPIADAEVERTDIVALLGIQNLLASRGCAASGVFLLQFQSHPAGLRDLAITKSTTM